MTNKDSKWLMVKVLCLLFGAVGICRAGGCAGNLAVGESKAETKADTIDKVLKRLSEKTAELKSYRSGIEYKFSQPLLESQTLRKGVMYYEKSDGGSKLRINFQTLKQDDEPQEDHIEQYIFDGVWLTHIDYQIKEVKRYQQAEPNEPVDTFDLARENFPIIGFSKTDELEEQFEIKLIERQEEAAEGSVGLNLKVKTDSIYKDDYTAIDFWIDKKMGLPARIVAVSTEEDVYEIKLLDAKVNGEMDAQVFDVKIPEGFGEEIIPLEKKADK